ncbi:MAG: right-handed parallel beta-helix repeat-containing protein [Deltaproteobacteria bacterium]|nr:right-handed parallel beta-helix repeat-containing protein [Deltaproteobacteria bacterium]
MRFRSMGILAAAAVAMLTAGMLGIDVAGAATLTVTCPASVQTAVNAACSNDVILVTGTCAESVVVGLQTFAAGCPEGVVPFSKLTIKGSGTKSSGATIIQGQAGPAITVTADAVNVTLQNMTVGSNTSHGIAVVSAHKVIINNVKTPTTLPLLGTAMDGVNVDMLSTNTMVTSCTLNGNLGDGVEMGATFGQIHNVTANDNGMAGIRITGSSADVQRCTAKDTTAPGVQQYGFYVDGPTAILQRSAADSNAIAQFFDAPASRGVIHFRNVAGLSNAAAPLPGDGFSENGSGNYISSCTSIRNMGHGVHMAGDGNELQLTVSSQNVGSQVLITGDRNLIDRSTALRVGTGFFTSVLPDFNVILGSTANFFVRCVASLESGAASGQGYAIPDATTTGTRNTRRPALPTDPPVSMR